MKYIIQGFLPKFFSSNPFTLNSIFFNSWFPRNAKKIDLYSTLRFCKMNKNFTENQWLENVEIHNFTDSFLYHPNREWLNLYFKNCLQQRLLEKQLWSMNLFETEVIGKITQLNFSRLKVRWSENVPGPCNNKRDGMGWKKFIFRDYFYINHKIYERTPKNQTK